MPSSEGDIPDEIELALQHIVVPARERPYLDAEIISVAPEAEIPPDRAQEKIYGLWSIERRFLKRLELGSDYDRMRCQQLAIMTNVVYSCRPAVSGRFMRSSREA